MEDRLLDIDGKLFADRFAREPFGVGHSLVDHPLLSLDAIAELADAVTPGSVERHEANLPAVMPGGAPDVGGRPSETVRGIDSNGCWMVLWYIEQVPEYAALLDACLDEVERYVADRHGVMCQREGFLFLSAPGATTPLHFDPEHNLLLQIRGTKEMDVGRFADPGVQQWELDRYHDGGHRNLENVPSEMTTFNMRPGDGVYVYPFAPHVVRNGPTASVSLSVTFRTVESRRVERVHRFNSRVRRLHLSPRPAGRSRTVDHAKAAIEGLNVRIRRVEKRRKPQRADA